MSCGESGFLDYGQTQKPSGVFLQKNSVVFIIEISEVKNTVVFFSSMVVSTLVLSILYVSHFHKIIKFDNYDELKTDYWHR